MQTEGVGEEERIEGQRQISGIIKIYIHFEFCCGYNTIYICQTHQTVHFIIFLQCYNVNLMKYTLV